ncbi:MAG: 50S ribosomal protein L11 methyltransferase [Gammaproteobacteria bacterium]|nr:50S ribosomal protein L11 methyltransferase [Gammaproteobacteria bacterium]
MTWLQINFDLTRDTVEAYEDALIELGALSVTLQDNEDEPVLEPGLGETPLWTATRLTALFTADIDSKAVLDTLESHLGTLAAHRVEILEDKDWIREWMDSYEPIQISPRLWVCPTWKEPVDAQAVNLLLDPGLAFGTGTHPTTYLCLEWLSDQTFRGESVLDYGCGSGILAITAQLLGAGPADGVDIDPQALIATEANAKTNGLEQGNIQVYLPEDAPKKAYDVTIANILAGPLAELAPTLIDSTKIGGKIVLSGLLAEQAGAVASAYGQHIQWADPTVKDGWARLDGIRIT